MVLTLPWGTTREGRGSGCVGSAPAALRDTNESFFHLSELGRSELTPPRSLQEKAVSGDASRRQAGGRSSLLHHGSSTLNVEPGTLIACPLSPRRARGRGFRGDCALSTSFPRRCCVTVASQVLAARRSPALHWAGVRDTAASVVHEDQRSHTRPRVDIPPLERTGAPRQAALSPLGLGA